MDDGGLLGKCLSILPVYLIAGSSLKMYLVGGYIIYNSILAGMEWNPQSLNLMGKKLLGNFQIYESWDLTPRDSDFTSS